VSVIIELVNCMAIQSQVLTISQDPNSKPPENLNYESYMHGLGSGKDINETLELLEESLRKYIGDVSKCSKFSQKN